MSLLSVVLVLVLLLYLFSVDWKEMGRVLREGAWFFILVYALLGVTIVKLFREGSGH